MDFSYQLYSARNAGSLDEVLKTLRMLGYTQVEGWGGQFADPAALAKSIKDAGLTMPTAHMGFTQLENTAEAARIAGLVGITTLYCPAPPSGDFREGKASWADFGAKLGKVADGLKGAGLGFGYHNHHWEFVKGADGKVPMDVLLEAAPNMEWEMDLAWVVKGGEDPVKWMDKYGSRISAVHVKDIAPAGEKLDEDGWADVGHGTLDWKSLLATIKAKTKAKYFVAEHDKPSDPIRFAKNSIASWNHWS
jgi:sugar phosphate isomerase/epimerase